MSSIDPASIEHLNIDCTCVTLDRDALCRAAEAIVGDATFCRDLIATHPHLLSAQPMFLSAAHAGRMQAIIAAIEQVAGTPHYRAAVLSQAPESGRFEPGPIGVFMGYDFHLGPDGPKLIEINTNAGGALINAYLLQAQRACCEEMALAAEMRFDLQALLQSYVASFASEWQRQGREQPLSSIAIVDRDPHSQYLYPEFVLFKRLFEAHGLISFIASPEALHHRDGGLWLGDRRIDLVYNRLTDFELAAPSSAAIRSAYLTGDVVVTPNPHAHALLANKANLTILRDPITLAEWGIPEETIACLRDGIPATVRVRGQDPERLWAHRGSLFFKPCSGFGSKAAWRGDKITRKVWSEILAGDYVAQEIVPPSARTVVFDGNVRTMKADLRNYTYDGQVQLVAARLYEGQTTNFRTPGGGFAPVFVSDQSFPHPCH
jgi:hypothetical protein